MSATGAVFDAMQLQAALLDVVATSHAPPRLISQRQQQRLLRLLEAAVASPLYRERLSPHAGRGVRSTDLARMPHVTRRELIERFDDWVTDPRLKLDELNDFLRDTSRIAEPWLGDYAVWESSGTSGQPGVFVSDARTLAVYDALEAVRHRVPPGGGRGLLRAFTAFDMLGTSDRYALVTATGGHFASLVSFERLRRINPWVAASSRSFSLLQPVDELVAALNEFRPSVLATYPTAAALLADEAEAGRLSIDVRCVTTGGETLSPAVRERLAGVFGAQVRGSYGASEFLPIAWECAHGHLHVNEDWVLLEPVDEHYRPLPHGQRSHSVLLTNLANTVQPLIRYDLGDRVLLPGERCSCGSALQVIDVQGRADDVLQVPARRQGQTVSLLPMALCTVVEEQGGVFDFQLQQQGPNTLVLRLPLRGEAAEAAIGRCRDALQHFALTQGAQPIVVLGEPGCEVPRGRSGKACRVAMYP